jgi:hypothetical protein
MMHATCNAAIYFVGQAMTMPTGRSPWLVGEGGVLTAASMVVVVLATRRLWRRPGE